MNREIYLFIKKNNSTNNGELSCLKKIKKKRKMEYSVLRVPADEETWISHQLPLLNGFLV